MYKCLSKNDNFFIELCVCVWSFLQLFSCSRHVCPRIRI